MMETEFYQRAKALRDIVAPDDIYPTTQMYLNTVKMFLGYLGENKEFQEDLKSDPVLQRIVCSVGETFYKQNQILNIVDENLNNIFES